MSISSVFRSTLACRNLWQSAYYTVPGHSNPVAIIAYFPKALSGVAIYKDRQWHLIQRATDRAPSDCKSYIDVLLWCDLPPIPKDLDRLMDGGA